MLFVLLFAPLYQGYLERLRARLFLRVGPPLVQPFRDQRKWSSKGTVRGTHTTWVSAIAPTIYFCAPLIVAILMPVLTRNPLPLAFMADMLGDTVCQPPSGRAAGCSCQGAEEAVGLGTGARVIPPARRGQSVR